MSDSVLSPGAAVNDTVALISGNLYLREGTLSSEIITDSDTC